MRLVKESLHQFFYHSTDIHNAKNILKSGKIKTYENILKAANQNPLDWYDDIEYGKYVYVSDFLHTYDNFYGLADLDVTFVINSIKIKHEILFADKHYEEGTISIKGNVPISAIDKIILINYDDELITMIKDKKIKFEIS